jgi:hypothetical protein
MYALTFFEQELMNSKQSELLQFDTQQKRLNHTNFSQLKSESRRSPSTDGYRKDNRVQGTICTSLSGSVLTPPRKADLCWIFGLSF